MFRNGPGAEISKRVTRALAGLGAIDPATLGSNAKGRQPEAGGRDAGYVVVVFIQR